MGYSGALWILREKWNMYRLQLECTRHKAFPRKASLQFRSEHISFFTVNLKVLLNVPSHGKHTQSCKTTQCKERLNWVRGIKTKQSIFTESFLLDFTSGYFFLHILRIVPKCPSSDSTKTVISSCSFERMVYLYETNTYITKQLLRTILCRFHWKRFPCSPQASGHH